jgi:hypothetical protein
MHAHVFLFFKMSFFGMLKYLILFLYENCWILLKINLIWKKKSVMFLSTLLTLLHTHNLPDKYIEKLRIWVAGQSYLWMVENCYHKWNRYCLRNMLLVAWYNQNLELISSFENYCHLVFIILNASKCARNMVSMWEHHVSYKLLYVTARCIPDHCHSLYNHKELFRTFFFWVSILKKDGGLEYQFT